MVRISTILLSRDATRQFDRKLQRQEIRNLRRRRRRPLLARIRVAALRPRTFRRAASRRSNGDDSVAVWPAPKSTCSRMQYNMHCAHSLLSKFRRLAGDERRRDSYFVPTTDHRLPTSAFAETRAELAQSLARLASQPSLVSPQSSLVSRQLVRINRRTMSRTICSTIDFVTYAPPESTTLHIFLRMTAPRRKCGPRLRNSVSILRMYSYYIGTYVVRNKMVTRQCHSIYYVPVYRITYANLRERLSSTHSR